MRKQHEVITKKPTFSPCQKSRQEREEHTEVPSFSTDWLPSGLLGTRLCVHMSVCRCVCTGEPESTELIVNLGCRFSGAPRSLSLNLELTGQASLAGQSVPWI